MKNLIILLLISAILAGCGKVQNESHEEKKTEEGNKEEKKETVMVSPESQEKINLETSVLKEEQFSGYLKIPAVIVTDQNNEAQVGPVVSGRVKKVFASVGTNVGAGQTLMLIEGLEIGVLKADFLKSKTTLSFTEQEFSRQKKLAELDAGSQKNLIATKAEYEMALAEFNAMDKKIHSIGLKDEDIINDKNDMHSAGELAIKSPISGVIVERNVVVGQYVESSSIAFKILNTRSLLVDGQMYESDFNRIGSTKSCEFRTPSVPDETFLCDITYKGQLIDEKTRTIKIRAKINNPRSRLIPQMFGDLIVKLAENRKGLFVPSSAVFKDGEQSFVFVQENDSTFRKTEVKTGIEIEERAEIVSGLKAGDKIVTNGVFELKSEMLKESFGEGD